ncbi:3-hydroxyacyl-CoA dehydrogenase/enoyl-CoA hydratase family protein [Haliangium ochraceum]|uniref:enoyl-CoA hydratase n=1 Tax=Haliangium ochraceum (strain DSM 14365 / JCM 11303 / SMP-2) TaxID=502025 RepID=D0LQ56_HALO1|nr:enoyl-CoA hydratase-related protein [Haliangium ochraceum]ACY17093.1 Enoyl-CoA hydratase/isomerase [Haliangium ochraceum DSM 14365]
MIVGVIGSGAIGPDLAYGFASALASVPGARVYLHDIKQEALDAGMQRIRGYIAKGLARGKISERVAGALETVLVPTLSLADLAPCSYVLEAATEELGVKRAILRSLEDTVDSECLIGFATSGLPRAIIAAEVKHPERCFVNHPFYPAWRSLPVEVVLSGSPAHGQRMLATLEALGKVPVITADAPCFAADDIFCNYCSEAARIVEEGIANPAQVDAIVHGAIGGGGPLNVLDATRGNLLTVHCQELMRDADTGTPWFEPPAILRERGDALWHDPKAPHDPAFDEALRERVLDRILAVLLARTVFVLDHGICAATELDWMTRTALGFRTGLVDLVDELGPERVAELCQRYAAEHPGFVIPDSIREQHKPRFYGNLRVTRQDELAIVRIFRPEVKNALDRRTLSELDHLMAALSADDSVEGVVLSSAGGALAGADITELARVRTTEEAVSTCAFGQAVLNRIAAMDKPVVAAVDGPVLGGGAELSMACHARVVGPRLSMGQPEVNLGIIPGYGGTQRLPRLIGVERALAMMRTAQSIDAQTACEWGWASGTPMVDFVGAAATLIRSHLAGEAELAPLDPAPMSVPAAAAPVDIGHRSRVIDEILVDVVQSGLRAPLSEGLATEAAGFGRCVLTVDLDIGLKNFMQNGPRVPALFLHE